MRHGGRGLIAADSTLKRKKMDGSTVQVTVHEMKGRGDLGEVLAGSLVRGILG